MRNSKILLLCSSVGTILLLGWAAYREHFGQEWRHIQRAYAQHLSEPAAAEFAVQLRQIVVPSLGVTDRCVSCHVGMAPGESGIAGDPVYGPHKQIVHDPAGYGCTVCHGGQGRATEKASAHGRVRFWPEP
ncbi:MAG: hypothetical protein FJW35_10235, partial [Acidobacteria bacterium]|nr:hypothetical protein [Acidobacteriota bacterium]